MHRKIDIQAAVEAVRKQRTSPVGTQASFVKGNFVRSERFIETYKGEHDKKRSRLVMGSSGLFNDNIDISWLPAAAESYKISADPRDYVLVEVPLVTVDIPNRNLQAFPYEEVSYFDPLYGRMIYSTFTGKPTHIDHDNKDPLKAKGVNFDAALRYVPEYDVWKIFVLSGYDRTKDEWLAKQILDKKRTGYCLVEGTLISTGSGLVPIESFHTSRNERESLSIQETVQTPNGLGTATNWYYSGKRQCRQITTENGLTVAGSLNQMVLLLKPDLTTDWVELSQVKQGDVVGTPAKMMEQFPDSLPLPRYTYKADVGTTRRSDISCGLCSRDVANLALHLKWSHEDFSVASYREQFQYEGPLTSFTSKSSTPAPVNLPTEMSPQLGTVLGYLVSEGWVSWVKDTYCTGFRTTSEEQAQVYKSAFNSVFGVECSESLARDAGKEAQYGDLTITSRKDGVQVYKYSRIIGEFLKLIAREGVAVEAKEKAVPWCILQAPLDATVSFLRALYLGDGSGSFRSTSAKTDVTYHSASTRLKGQVQMMLQRLGVRSRLVSYGDKDLVISGAEDVERFHKIVFGSDYDSGKDPRGVDCIPYLLEKLPQRTQDRSSYRRDCRPWLITRAGQNFLSRAEDEVQACVQTLLNMDVRWETISAVDDIGERETFDLTVAGPRGELADPSCFVAGGLYLHNSMGALVENFVCSISGQTDTNIKPSKYTKGEVFDGNLAYQLCVGVNYIENSSVDDPADITADTEQFWP